MGEPRSPAVSSYQRLLGPVLGNECSLKPSDSANSQLLASICGPGVAALKAMARFYLEPDVSTLGVTPLIYRNRFGELKITYEDLPNSCRIF